MLAARNRWANASGSRWANQDGSLSASELAAMNDSGGSGSGGFDWSFGMGGGSANTDNAPVGQFVLANSQNPATTTTDVPYLVAAPSSSAPTTTWYDNLEQNILGIPAGSATAADRYTFATENAANTQYDAAINQGQSPQAAQGNWLKAMQSVLGIVPSVAGAVAAKNASNNTSSKAQAQKQGAPASNNTNPNNNTNAAANTLKYVAIGTGVLGLTVVIVLLATRKKK